MIVNHRLSFGDALTVGTKLNLSRDTSEEVLAGCPYNISVICAGSANKNNVNTAGMEKNIKSFIYFQHSSVGCN